MLRIEHYSKTYPGGKKAVDDLSLHVRPGEIYEGVAVLADVGGALVRRKVVQVGDEVQVVDALHELVQVRVVGVRSPSSRTGGW